jgi:catechol 2,3-dioxygenase-like lactoylglutathione lyase family enzyme
MNSLFNLRRSKPAALVAAFLLAVGLTAAPLQRAHAQTPDLLGVDHVGINVPDLNQAVTFFTDVLGFTPVTQLGPVPLDAAWKQANHLHAGTGPVTIKMVRAGTGASIELFHYQASEGSQQQPGGDDIGATHISFYTSDIKASVAYMKSKGVKFLGEPLLMTSGNTAGETWVYFETPWGSKMELNSYPAGKAYEKTNPAVKLWSPEDATMSATGQAITQAEANALVNRHLRIWNQQDDAKRNALLPQTYARDFEMVDRHFIVNSYGKLNEFVNDLHRKSPGYVFSPAKPIVAHNNVVRLYWQCGPPSNPKALTGMGLFVVENGKLQKLYVFADEPQPAKKATQSPKSSPISPMTTEEILALLTRHLGVLNNLDKASRAPALAGVYAENLLFIDPYQESTGSEHFDAFLQNLHQKFPGAVFQLAQPIDVHHHIARINWNFGPPANPTAVTGQDTVVLADGKVQAIYVFLNKAGQ